MAEIMKHERVFSFLHIPVQSGSDQVPLHLNLKYYDDNNFLTWYFLYHIYHSQKKKKKKKKKIIAKTQILHDMKREYTQRDFITLFDGLCSQVPDIYIATDFIVGFPNEREADHADSINLIKRYARTHTNKKKKKKEFPVYCKLMNRWEEIIKKKWCVIIIYEKIFN